MWLMGDVQMVTAQIDTALNNYNGCDEFGEGIMRFANGIIGTIAAGWVDVFNTMPILVAGTEGQVYVNDGQVYFKSKHVAGADGKSPTLWTSLPDELPHAFNLFLDAVQGQKVPLATVREAADRTAVMEAFYQAAESCTWVEPHKA